VLVCGQVDKLLMTAVLDGGDDVEERKNLSGAIGLA
jgi:hypothetical protein